MLARCVGPAEILPETYPVLRPRPMALLSRDRGGITSLALGAPLPTRRAGLKTCGFSLSEPTLMPSKPTTV